MHAYCLCAYLSHLWVCQGSPVLIVVTPSLLVAPVSTLLDIEMISGGGQVSGELCDEAAVNHFHHLFIDSDGVLVQHFPDLSVFIGFTEEGRCRVLEEGGELGSLVEGAEIGWFPHRSFNGWGIGEFSGGPVRSSWSRWDLGGGMAVWDCLDDAGAGSGSGDSRLSSIWGFGGGRYLQVGPGEGRGSGGAG